MKTRKRIECGKYIVSDPEICGGEWTFKGTRMFVKDALEMLTDGYDFECISEAFYGRVNREAILEAVRLAGQTLVERDDKEAERALSW